MIDFTDKVAIISGAASGIGRAAVEKFVTLGAKVLAVDIDMEGLAETAALSGGDITTLYVDVSDEDNCQKAVDLAIETYGRVDVLCNNAGIGGVAVRLADMKTADWQKVIDVNLTSLFYFSRAALPAMQSSGGGVIVNLASVDGHVAMSTFSHYTAAKHGVVGLTKCIALEYARDNIRCVAVAPGFVRTNMTESGLSDSERELLASLIPMGRTSSPEEVSNLITWLASSEASYITGSCHTIDGGILSGFTLPE